jgi:hypothetical protein
MDITKVVELGGKPLDGLMTNTLGGSTPSAGYGRTPMYGGSRTPMYGGAATPMHDGGCEPSFYQFTSISTIKIKCVQKS